MGNAIIKTGGVGADSDELTANKEHVLAGYTAITHDSDGDPITGTMPNRGVGSHAVNSGINDKGLWYYIPPGYYPSSSTDEGNCWVYRTQAEVAATAGLTANKLIKNQSALGIAGTATSDANAAANHILSGKTAYVNGSKITGNIASLTGQTITPNTTQQTVSSSGKYMTGNVVVPGFTMPPANVLKKGYTLKIYNQQVTGTFEGYVTGAADIYRQGAINPNYSLGLYNCPEYEDSDGNHYQAITQFRTNTIYVHTSYNEHWSNSIQVHNAIDLTPINKIHISIRVADGKTGPKSTEVAFGVYDGVGFVDKPVAGYVGRFSAYSTYDEVSFSVKSITRPLYLRFWFSCDSHVSWEIDHIWFD